ncbi:hypothetical protein FB45DRAFT_931416 [Roridomyces roridus]|uniref:F-box domain-containing protein n=1 Tax=Roridomyces roridus TaxID=1738132 RepID=A0AAD7BG60_9AGAR|nr:hypothetical protein FB45DRAFT_931416 [Roridomyces roridus]
MISLPADGLFTQSLKLMRRLEHLTIRDVRQPSGAISYLPTLTFPNLLSCFIIERRADAWKLHITQFLSRHPTITHIRLSESYSAVPVREGGLLPKLQYYDGPIHLPSFSSHGLIAARTYWVSLLPITTRVEKLCPLTGPNLTSFCIHSPISAGRVIEVLVHLSIHIPHLEKLEMHCSDESRGTVLHFRSFLLYPVLITTQETVNAYLSRCERLEYLAFCCGQKCERSTVDDRRMLQLWTNTSSTLRGCCIGNTAWRKVEEMWEECSLGQFDMEAGFSVFEEFKVVR